MCIYIYIYMHTSLSLYIYIYTCVYIYIYIYTYVHNNPLESNPLRSRFLVCGWAVFNPMNQTIPLSKTR